MSGGGPGFPAGGEAWSGRTVWVAGLGMSGLSAVVALRELGAHVVAVDERESANARAAEATGAIVRLGAEHTRALVEPRPDLVVTSPGWRPDQPLLAAAGLAGIPVIGDVELAWALRRSQAAPWLALTGTNGKTTTVRMLTAILTAAGRRAVAVGNVGAPLIDAVRAQPPYDVLAVELSSFQLHWAPSPAPLAAAVLNIADDHLDWHGGFDAYAAAKAHIFDHAGTAVANADDPPSLAALAGATGRPVTFTLGVPGPGQLGVVAGRLVDRAFTLDGAGVVLAEPGDVRLPGPHNVANALAAAALARAYGVGPGEVAAGLAATVADPHRAAAVATVAGVRYVDDSKATNPHAAAASLAAHSSVVWIAGGLLKGAAVDDVVDMAAGRLRGVVLIGADRAVLAAALARHAPRVPVIEVLPTETEPVSVPGSSTPLPPAARADFMTRVVAAAAGLARDGDVVLLAPAAASMDQFRDYGERGSLFADAVHALADGRGAVSGGQR